ncbi:RNase P protein subunit [Cavenderia fasciculata]|uniref:RNase P protein subunit n=1 Tax=Cavenderia fasciculata TaxID=261658 RepID=F4PGZ6_CACFS|nr:RNase P protein subunit [Cavenderia fasciculata]EGG24980.1 RNase P protein subunit [Cavenderia fasciculata]|eukprot:XP_004362831.1 RNase P protein subunit [Cavenderia fasciculata]
MSKNKQNVIVQDTKHVEVDDDDIEFEEEEDSDIELGEDDQDYDPTFNPKLYSYMRRVTQHNAPAINDIYVTNNGNFLYYCKRAMKLLQNKQMQEINIHGLGAAIIKAIKLSLYLEKRIPDIVIGASTSTEEIIDHYDPNVDKLEPVSKIRHCSAIHIKVTTKPNQIPSTISIPKPLSASERKKKKKKNSNNNNNNNNNQNSSTSIPPPLNS